MLLCSSLAALFCFTLSSDVLGSVTPCLLVLLYNDDKGITGSSYLISYGILCLFHLSSSHVNIVEIKIEVIKINCYKCSSFLLLPTYLVM